MADESSDRVYIRDLAVRCIIGVYPEERRDVQDLVLNIAMHANLAEAGRSDDILDTVDYKTVKKRVLAAVEKSEFRLIEALAERIASVVLESPRVNRVEVTIDKPGALRFARSVAVQISRSRPKPS